MRRGGVRGGRSPPLGGGGGGGRGWWGGRGGGWVGAGGVVVGWGGRGGGQVGRAAVELNKKCVAVARLLPVSSFNGLGEAGRGTGEVATPRINVVIKEEEWMH